MRDMPRTRTALVDPDVRLFAALADPTRLAFVRELAGAETVCACDFSLFCNLSRPTVSHHLRVLREAGVIESERSGNQIYYRLAPGAAGRLRGIATELEGESRRISASDLRKFAAAASAGSA